MRADIDGRTIETKGEIISEQLSFGQGASPTTNQEPFIALSPAKDDLVLRPLALANGARHYVLLTAVSQQHVSGPFETLGDAVSAAREIALERRVTVWHQQVDDRGRIMGDLRRLFSVSVSDE